MKPTSDSEFTAARNGVLPRMERVRESVWTLPISHPNKRIRYTLGYLIKDSRSNFHVVDPGWDSVENWRALGSAISSLGGVREHVESIIVTHLHPDHLGMATRLREASGAPVAMHRREQEALDRLVSSREARLAVGDQELEDWGVVPERRPELMAATMLGVDLPGGAEVLLDDDDLLDIAGHSLRVLRTPGHTPGHICIKDEEKKLLLTGDHIMPTVNPGLGLGGATTTNPIADYLESLNAISGMDDYEVCPGHEYRFTGLRERCDAMIRHHLRRTHEVEEAVRKFPNSTIWELAEHIGWSAGWSNLRDFFLHSALAQTAMYVDYIQSESRTKNPPDSAGDLSA